jgi:hypothetical protein
MRDFHCCEITCPSLHDLEQHLKEAHPVNNVHLSDGDLFEDKDEQIVEPEQATSSKRLSAPRLRTTAANIGSTGPFIPRYSSPGPGSRQNDKDQRPLISIISSRDEMPSGTKLHMSQIPTIASEGSSSRVNASPTTGYLAETTANVHVPPISIHSWSDADSLAQAGEIAKFADSPTWDYIHDSVEFFTHAMNRLRS